MIFPPNDSRGLDVRGPQGRHRAPRLRMSGAPTNYGDTAPIAATSATMCPVSLGRGTPCAWTVPVRAELVAATERCTWL